MRRVVIVLVVLVLALAALLATRLRVQERALRGPTGGSGEIEGTEVDLSARISARVARLHVKKGAVVRKGDLLVSLDCADARASLSEAQERLTAAEEQARAAEASIGQPAPPSRWPALLVSPPRRRRRRCPPSATPLSGKPAGWTG